MALNAQHLEPHQADLSTLSVEVHSSFPTIADDWRQFEKHAISTPFQSYSWLSAWYDTVGRLEGLEPLFVCVRDAGGKLVFLLPLAVSHAGALGRIAWDMGQPVCDYHSPLMAESFVRDATPEAMRSLWERAQTAIEGVDAIVLIKQPDHIGFLPNPMMSLCKSPYYTPTAYQTDLRPYENYQEFVQTVRSSKARQTLNRKRNKLKRCGEVEFKLLTSAAEKSAALESLLALKRRDLEQAAKRHVFDDPGVDEFLSAVTSTSENIHMFRLSCGDQTVALTLALCWQKRLHYFIATYRAGEFARSSPGLLALCDAFEWSLDNGYEQFDFTVGDEAYKLNWSDQETQLYSGTFALTPRGQAAARLEAAKLSLKHTIKSSPVMYAAASKLLFHSQR